MKLSVIIVNYNVEYFLEQCLHSVFKALERVDGEVLVVDNASVDGSLDMVRKKFPSVRLFANEENLGFARANDRAIEEANGEYVLLLNPDTVVEEDTFERTLAFMEEHPDAGGLGVKMLDGNGRFLPESKRALPTPEVAFYKIFGLSSLFPRSKRFGKYHLGYLDEDEVHEIEVLSGAFMLLRRSALEKVGYLDTSFFMYGEDIDLSYRLIEGGYRNYYYPHTRIIHYKGESTKKSSVNYVLVFYRAMLIFADKHFTRGNRRLFRFILRSAIYFRAFLAILNRGLQRVALPLFDALFIFGGSYGIQEWYETVKGTSYPEPLVVSSLVGSTLIWMLGVLFSGGYDPPVRKRRILRGLLGGTLVILIAYSLLPEEFRFSRAVVLLSSIWAALVFFLSRWGLARMKVPGFTFGNRGRERVAIVGEPDEGERIGKLLDRTRDEMELVGIISPDPDQDFDRERSIIGNVDRLSELIRVHGIEELVFAARDVPAQRMIDLMASVEDPVDHKIAPPESYYVIGSRSVDRSWDIHAIDMDSVSRPENRRNKRVLDVLFSLLFLLLFPFLFFWVREPKGLLRNIFMVLGGSFTWVGYYAGDENASRGWRELPSIPPGILHPLIASPKEERIPEMTHKMNLVYAKDYRLWNDISVILKGVRELGKDPRKGGE